MSRRTRTAGGEAAPNPTDFHGAATINSIKFSELSVGIEVEGDKFAGVATVTKVVEMPARSDDNGDRVAVVYLKRSVGRMPMDPNYVMSYDKFWLVGAKTQTPQDARDEDDDDFYVAPAPKPKRSRAQIAKDFQSKALKEAAAAQERVAKRQREMQEDAENEEARTAAPAAAPPPAQTQAQWLQTVSKEHIEVMSVSELKTACESLGLSNVGLKKKLQERLVSHLKLGGAASGFPKPSRAKKSSNPPVPPTPPPGTTTNAAMVDHRGNQQWFPQVVIEGGELSTHEKELLSDKGKEASSACLGAMQPGELKSTYLNVTRRTNKEITNDELIKAVDELDRAAMLAPLEAFVGAGRLTLYVNRDDGLLKMGLYHSSTADLHAAEALADGLASRGAVVVRLVPVALFACDSSVTRFRCLVRVQNFKVPQEDHDGPVMRALDVDVYRLTGLTTLGAAAAAAAPVPAAAAAPAPTTLATILSPSGPSGSSDSDDAAAEGGVDDDDEVDGDDELAKVGSLADELLGDDLLGELRAETLSLGQLRSAIARKLPPPHAWTRLKNNKAVSPLLKDKMVAAHKKDKEAMAAIAALEKDKAAMAAAPDHQTEDEPDHDASDGESARLRRKRPLATAPADGDGDDRRQKEFNLVMAQEEEADAKAAAKKAAREEAATAAPATDDTKPAAADEGPTSEAAHAEATAPAAAPAPAPEEPAAADEGATSKAAQAEAKAPAPVPACPYVELAGMVVRHEKFVGELNFWDGHWSALARDANKAPGVKTYRIQTMGNVKTIPILKQDGPPTSWSPLLLDAKLKLRNVKATHTVVEAVQGHFVSDGSRTGKSVGDYAKMLAASSSLPMTVGRITLILRDYSTNIPPQWRALMQVIVRNVSDDSYFAQYICVNLSSVEVRPGGWLFASHVTDTECVSGMLARALRDRDVRGGHVQDRYECSPACDDARRL